MSIYQLKLQEHLKRIFSGRAMTLIRDADRTYGFDTGHHFPYDEIEPMVRFGGLVPGTVVRNHTNRYYVMVKKCTTPFFGVTQDMVDAGRFTSVAYLTRRDNIAGALFYTSKISGDTSLLTVLSRSENDALADDENSIAWLMYSINKHREDTPSTEESVRTAIHKYNGSFLPVALSEYSFIMPCVLVDDYSFA